MAGTPSRYLALLRGINVGGRNVIPQADLRRCFERLGFGDVRTYIQSGNVLFRSGERSATVRDLTTTIESALARCFRYDAHVVVLPHRKYRAAVRAAPPDWGADDGDRRHNALFTLAGVSPKRILAQLPAPKADLETVTPGPGVIFWSASRKHVTRTTMMKISGQPVYRQLTVRNHKTTFSLLELLDEM